MSRWGFRIWVGLIVGAWMLGGCKDSLVRGTADEYSRNRDQAFNAGVQCVLSGHDKKACEVACGTVLTADFAPYCVAGVNRCPSCLPADRDPVPK